MLGWCWHKNSSLGNPSSELFYNIEQIKIPTYCILRISTLLWSICQHTGCPLHAVSALLVPLHVVFLLLFPVSSVFPTGWRFPRVSVWRCTWKIKWQSTSCFVRFWFCKQWNFNWWSLLLLLSKLCCSHWMFGSDPILLLLAENFCYHNK